MSKQYVTLAKDIVRLVGGKENVTNAFHCQTRVRFSLADEGKADQAAIEKLDGVISVLRSGGQFQVVIGPQVADVYEEIEPLLDLKASDADAAPAEKKGVFEVIVDFISGTFQPIIPALSGAGMVKAVMALLVVFNLIDKTSQTYYMLNLFSDGVFYFLPILLAFCEAQKLKCNPILAAGVAAMMLHPNWSALVTAGDPVNFFGVIPFTLASYGSSVIPIILVIFVQSYVEKWLNKHIAKSVNLVFVPMITFIVMGTLAFSVLGPLGYLAGKALASVFTFLAENAAWAPAVLIGGLCPVMVMFGLHNGIAPLGVMQMSQLGYDSIWGPGNIVSNMCQATAGLVVALRTKDPRIKQTAGSGSITAFMGITEPILYGVNLPKKYPLVASMIGGAAGGLYAGLTHTHRFATGSGGLPAILLYIGDDTLQYMINIIIAMVIGCAITAALTFFLSLRYEGKDEDEASDQKADALPEAKSGRLMAPVSGTVMPIDQSADPVFASKALGEGVAIDPTDGVVISPCNGSVTALFPTLHAIGITSDNGAEVMVHIGINTVELQGKYFSASVKVGDKVRIGQKLVTFDKDKVVEAGYNPQTMVVVTNSPSFKSVTSVATGAMTSGDALLDLEA
jgi:PTS system beta-glucosides-specific IIC component